MRVNEEKNNKEKLQKIVIKEDTPIDDIILEEGDVIYIKEEYQGWTNWETWNMALWADNEEAMYKDRVATQKKIKKWDANSVKKFLLGYYPKGTPDMEPKEISKVNWKEIADSFNEDEF